MMAVIVGLQTVVGFAIRHIHNPEDTEDGVLVAFALIIPALVLMLPLISENEIQQVPAAIVWFVWLVLALHTIGRGRMNSEGSA